MEKKDLENIIIIALDKIGLELRVWHKDYFGRKSEEKLIERFVDILFADFEKYHNEVVADLKDKLIHSYSEFNTLRKNSNSYLQRIQNLEQKLRELETELGKYKYV